MDKLKTRDYHIFVMALAMSITAETKESADECFNVSQNMATVLNDIQVARAKREVKNANNEDMLLGLISKSKGSIYG